MKCPVCSDTNLVMADRQGVEIDYCPECRGVWLDRGELDKIIERSAVAVAPSGPRPAERSSGGYSGSRDNHSHGYQNSHGYQKKKKGGFLGELFDF